MAAAAKDVPQVVMIKSGGLPASQAASYIPTMIAGVIPMPGATMTRRNRLPGATGSAAAVVDITRVGRTVIANNQHHRRLGRLQFLVKNNMESTRPAGVD